MNTSALQINNRTDFPIPKEGYRKEDDYSSLTDKLKNTGIRGFQNFKLMICSQGIPCEGYISNEENSTHDLIQLIYTQQFIFHRERIANRLFVLQKAAKEDEPDSTGISLSSLQGFYDFLLQQRNLKYPTITLSPDNNIYASWRAEQGRVFSVHFLENNDVRFVIFMPNEKRPGRKIRYSGNATTDTVLEHASAALGWIL